MSSLSTHLKAPGSAPADDGAQSARTFYKAALLLVLLSFLSLVCAALFTEALLARWPPANRWLALLLVVLCAMPPLLMRFATFMIGKNQRSRPPIEAPDAPSGLGDRWQEEVWSSAVRHARDRWIFEQTRVPGSMEHLREYSVLFGLLCTIILCIAVLVVLPSVRCAAGGPLSLELGDLQIAAVTAGTAVMVQFFFTFGVALRRAAKRDLNCKMLAWACSDLLVAVLCALFFLILFIKLSSSTGDSESPDVLTGMLVGSSAALLRTNALSLMTAWARRLLGAGPAPSDGADLSSLQGLTVDDILRLREEGIDSVNALATASTPQLFFHTGYKLDRICGWQAQALLVDRLKSVLGASTVRDVLELEGRVRDLVPAGGGEPTEAALDQLIEGLGLKQGRRTRGLLKDLLNDPEVARLRFFKGCTMHPDGVPGDRHEGDDPPPPPPPPAKRGVHLPTSPALEHDVNPSAPASNGAADKQPSTTSGINANAFSTEADVPSTLPGPPTHPCPSFADVASATA